MGEKRAIIDIGSNTVRLVVYNGPPRAPVILLNEKVAPRLGRDVARTGLLSEGSMKSALAALHRYSTLLNLMEVSDVQTVATAAVRDAGNGPEFLKAIERTGLAPRLLSGGEEARISAMGVIAAFPGANGVAADLGGGSLELTRISNEKCHEAITLPLGSLRLPELRTGGHSAFVKRVHQLLREQDWTFGQNEPLFIAGGSWRALALYAMDQLAWPLDDPHDFELSSGDAERLCAQLALDGPAEVVSRISSSRFEMLPHAAALLGTLVTTLKPSRVVFSSWGLREGLLYSTLNENLRDQNPVVAGISAFVKRYDVSADTAALVSDWIDGVVPHPDDIDRPLRLCATMLALAAMRIEPNVRTEEALGWALRKRWVGLDSKGRALIAAAALANTGELDVPVKLLDFANTADFEWAVSWGLAVRFARKLTNCNVKALSRSALCRDGDRLVLTLDDVTAPLFSNSVAKNLGRLADQLGLEGVVERANAR